MAIRNIVKEGDPILNKVCRPVTNFDDRLATLLDDMRETMIAADGVGLAGPQVGMMRRLFVVWDTTDAPEEIPEDYEYKFIDFVNPEILAVSEEEETAYEGCLSFPGHNGAVTRPVAVKVRAQDRNGEWFELEADGLLKLAHGGNRKSKYVCLTEKGARLAERTVDRIAEAEAEALLGLSDGEREALFSLLQKYNRLLRARLDAPGGSGTATGEF